MKALIAVLLLFVSTMILANTENFTLPVNFEVKMGELTGAGSSFSVKRLEGFIYNEQVILKSDCDQIVLRDTVDPKISDVMLIKVDNLSIDSKKLNGFIISK